MVNHISLRLLDGGFSTHCLSKRKGSKMKAKGNQRWLGGAKIGSPISFLFLNEGGKFFGCRKLPLPRFLYFGARVAHPGELTCHFFWRYHEHGPLRVGVRLLEPTLTRLSYPSSFLHCYFSFWDVKYKTQKITLSRYVYLYFKYFFQNIFFLYK